MIIHSISQKDQQAVDEFIMSRWYTMQMVVHGECIDLAAADGYYACENNEIIGLITYRITDGELEILSLDSIIENKGIGSALLGELISKAKSSGCSRIMLIMTNDNTYALRFYQKRGFDMVRLYRNALDISRKIKPEIPLSGEDGIPIKHEIELELIL